MSKEKNGNLKLKVESTSPGETWRPYSVTTKLCSVLTQARGKEPENRGLLKVNDKLEGTSAEDTVSNQDFEVFITAEDNAKIEVPSEPKLLKGDMMQPFN